MLGEFWTENFDALFALVKDCLHTCTPPISAELRLFGGSKEPGYEAIMREHIIKLWEARKVEL